MQQKFNLKQIKLVIGLGNPGKKYEGTYHNIGFLFVDYLTNPPAGGPISKPLKSSVHMNESGKFVRASMKKRGVKPKELLIVHDDSDIILGSYRFSYRRGSAGHKGVESIVRVLKTKNFSRLRIGIRPKKAGLPAGLPAKALASAGARRAKAGELVLKKITPSHRKTLEEVFKKIEKDCFSFT
ncbi:MAG: aminoacyl-tRNA hydrolase [Patescibacteria group bacterium]|nr:aminoacyl-tRNA hydrolase [Patescibacteria group bacterium]